VTNYSLLELGSILIFNKMSCKKERFSTKPLYCEPNPKELELA
jgi:hypothetical protein